MSGSSRFSVDLAAERLVVCDRAPALVDGVPASCRWGAPGLWRAVTTADGVQAVFELPEPRRLEPHHEALLRLRRGPALRRVGVETLMRDLALALGTGGSREATEPAGGRGPDADAVSPGSTLPPRPAWGPGESPGAAALHWALATADGSLDRSWSAPPRPGTPGGPALHDPTLGPWFAGHSLPLRTRLVWTPRRVAVVLPVLAELPPRLAVGRRAWAEALCLEARSRWVIARTVVRRRGVPSRGREAGCVAAEVDLSGAPAPLLPRLVVEARAALALVAEDLSRRLRLVLDPGVPSRLLARPPAGQPAPLPPADGVSAGPSSPLRNRQTHLPW